MTKHPAPGRVKARLAAVLGPDRAARLYRAFVLDLAERLASLPYEVTWAYHPRTAPFAALLPEARCRAQQGRDLGARMAHAIGEALRGGPTAVLVIGADSPHVPLAYLARAADALAQGTDLVLGPADDGGYYLIGVRAPQPALFTAMPWGTAEVLAATRARAARLGLRCVLLPSSFDLDEPADLERLRRLLARGDVRLPRTAALLATASAPSP